MDRLTDSEIGKQTERKCKLMDRQSLWKEDRLIKRHRPTDGQMSRR